jgi:hypothetical protein
MRLAQDDDVVHALATDRSDQPVCTENSDSDIVVMQPTEEGV